MTVGVTGPERPDPILRSRPTVPGVWLERVSNADKRQTLMKRSGNGVRE
jgi:hypothetical protein